MATMQKQAGESYSSRIKHACSDAEARVADTVDHHPVSSVLCAVGVGFGLGLMLGMALSESMPHRRSRSTMEELGHSVWETASKYMPKSLAG